MRRADASRASSLLSGSAWGPGHLAAGEEMDVEVGDGFAAVGTVVDDGTESLVPAELGGEFGDDRHHVAEEGGVFGSGFADAHNVFFGDEQEMGGGLGIDVLDDDAFVVFVLDGGRDLAVDDFLEDGFFV